MLSGLIRFFDEVHMAGILGDNNDQVRLNGHLNVSGTIMLKRLLGVLNGVYFGRWKNGVNS